MARVAPNAPSLATGVITLILGILVLTVSPLLIVPGIRTAAVPDTGALGLFLVAGGILVVALGCVLLAIGAKMLHRFERRLMVAMRSKPWTTD